MDSTSWRACTHSILLVYLIILFVCSLRFVLRADAQGVMIYIESWML